MLKKIFHPVLVVSLLAMGLVAAACSESNDDGGNGGNGGNEGGGNTPANIELTGDTSSQQQVYADDKQAPAPIKFTAKAPWTATVAAVPTKAEGGSEVDWLDLSAYSGGAGDVSLTITLSPNYTGQDRKAEIRITCGGTTIVITVEQKGKTESGEVPEDPNEPKPNPIELSGETPTQQTVWADETQTPKNIAFKALAPWTATVAEVQTKAEAEAGRVDWLALSAYEGGAGEVSLTITLKPNLTGQDRKAEIRIECAGTTIVITVEQKATTESGEKPAQSDLKNRIVRIDANMENYDRYGKANENSEFTYDEAGRVVGIKRFLQYDDQYGDRGHVDEEEIMTITYSDKTVAYESICKSNGSVVYQDNSSIELDENGRGVSGTYKTIREDDGTWGYTNRFTYDANGQLVKTEEISDSSYKDLYTTTWTNGNPTQGLWSSSDNPSYTYTDQAAYETIENKTNLDLNWLIALSGANFAGGSYNDIFAAMGYMGKRPKNMAKNVTNGYIKYTYEYQLDGQGRITKIVEIISKGPTSNEYIIHYAE